MSNDRTPLTVVVSGIALLLTNLYWWRRERTVRESLTVSKDRNATNTELQRDIREAAAVADVSPDALPEEIERLRERVAAQNTDLERYSTQFGNVRARWADLWRDALISEAVNPDEPHVIALVIPGGETDDARAAAKRAAEQNHWIAIVGAGADGTFVVKVGEKWTEQFPASAIARDLVEAVGGGAGGSPRSATGGVAAAGDLRSAIETLKRTIEDDEAFGDRRSA